MSDTLTMAYTLAWLVVVQVVIILIIDRLIKVMSKPSGDSLMDTSKALAIVGLIMFGIFCAYLVLSGPSDRRS